MKTLLIAALIAIAVAPAVSAGGLTRAADKKRLQPAADTTGSQFTDAEIRGQINAFLGSIDTPIQPSQWEALGPRAEPMLEAIARNQQEFSSRRARALDGLGAGKWSGSKPVLKELARDETQPANVRFHAVRSLALVLPQGSRSSELTSLMTGAKDSRVRAVAAEQLAKVPGGCTAFAKQIAREDEAVRGQFHRAAETCGTK